MAQHEHEDLVRRLLESTNTRALSWSKVDDADGGRHAARLSTGQVLRIGVSTRFVKRKGTLYKYEGVELTLLNDQGVSAVKLHSKVGDGQDIADLLDQLRDAVLGVERAEEIGKAIAALGGLGARGAPPEAGEGESP